MDYALTKPTKTEKKGQVLWFVVMLVPMWEQGPKDSPPLGVFRFEDKGKADLAAKTLPGDISVVEIAKRVYSV